MMKNGLKALSLVLGLGALIFVSSCGDDEENSIIPDPDNGGETGGKSFIVSDGLYMFNLGDSSVSFSNELVSARVEGEGFAPTDRSGHSANFMYLAAGEYTLANIKDQKVESVVGGTVSAVDTTGAPAGGYLYMDVDGTAGTINISDAGVYHVIHDVQESEAYFIKVNSWGVIGSGVWKEACVSDGFSADVDMTEVSSGATGSSWEIQGVILRGGEFKFRYNDTWTVGSYLSFTNVGENSNPMVLGGGNIAIPDGDGTYNVTLSLDDAGEFSFTATKAGEDPGCDFDPATFAWGIIGAATLGSDGREGWNDHKELIYVGQVDGSDTWRGVFPIKDGGGGDAAFKFRADDNWVNKITPGTDGVSVTITDNTEAGTLSNDAATNADAQWFAESLPGGYIYVVISTPDQGATWAITLDEAEWSLIGEGSPVGNWDAGNGQAMTFAGDLSTGNTSLTGSGTFTTAGSKVFVNQSFDYNLGGALDGTTTLLFNDNTFNLDAAGDYTITLSTNDGGETYVASAAN